MGTVIARKTKTPAERKAALAAYSIRAYAEQDGYDTEDYRDDYRYCESQFLHM